MPMTADQIVAALAKREPLYTFAERGGMCCAMCDALGEAGSKHEHRQTVPGSPRGRTWRASDLRASES